MRKTKIAVAAIAAASVWATVAAAQPDGPPSRHGGPPFMDNGAMHAIGALMHVDGLSDDQQQQMHSILESGRTTAEPLFAQLRTANQTLTDQLLGSDSPSADALSASLGQIDSLRKQLDQQQVRTVQSLRGVLTADQLEQALQRSQQFAAAHGMVSSQP